MTFLSSAGIWLRLQPSQNLVFSFYLDKEAENIYTCIIIMQGKTRDTIELAWRHPYCHDYICVPLKVYFYAKFKSAPLEGHHLNVMVSAYS